MDKAIHFSSLSDLHEMLYCFLLQEQRERALQGKTPIYYALRAAEEKEALEQGRWFWDWPEKESINLYFSKVWEEDIQKENTSLVVKQNSQCFFLARRLNYGWFKLLYYSFEDLAYWNEKKHSGTQFLSFKKPVQELLSSILDTFSEMQKKWEGTGGYEKRHDYEQYKTSPYPKPIEKAEFEKNLQHIEALRLKKRVRSISLHSAHIVNYAALGELSLAELPSEASWVFLTGENGYGKSLVLQSLALAAQAVLSEQAPYSAFNAQTQLSLRYRLHYEDGQSLEVVNTSAYPKYNRALETLVCYGVSRLRVHSLDSEERQLRNQKIYPLFHSDAILRNIEKELILAFFAQKEKYQSLKNMLLRLVPSLQDIEPQVNEQDLSASSLLYYEKKVGEEEPYPKPMSFTQLASGLRSIIALVGDLYLRLSEAYNKEQKAKGSTSGFIAPEELYGLVLIDELDLHLHPKWQKELPSLLSSVFPRLRFFASTHSPIPLLGAPKHSVFLKVERDAKGSIYLQRLEQLEKEIGELLPQQILSSELFGEMSIYPKQYDKDKSIRTENSYQDIVSRDGVDKELKELLQGSLGERLKKIFSKE